MQNEYAVIAEYPEFAEGRVTFPEGKTWDDVEDWYVKWDCLNLKFKDEKDWREFALSSTGESDWKRPASVQVLGVDEDDCADWDNIIVEN